MKDDHIFALDIGTRSVTGVILKKDDSTYTLIDYCVKEHRVRSMVDGQIHHVEEVAKVIKDVKETLETSHGPLHKVCVAAAGRSLKTITSSAKVELNHKPVTEYETIKHLELSAVHAAQLKLASEDSVKNFSNYYCVGYSVLHYKIDNDKIGSLIDQSGQIASVDIIATFLPKVVVESLLSALTRSNLEMDALTLEPIAAIQVLIPESMRRLNVALVDIGAGTSDIALTNSGTVVAYGMVPIAGDEITEAVSDHYLLDFPLAEQTKVQIVKNGQATVQDILGFDSTITYQDLVNDINENIDKLATSIAEEILRLNGSQPKAVMLIGGGSQTPDFTTRLASKLQLPTNRVAIRDIEAIQILNQTDNLPKGPDFVTPIGIAIAAKQNPIHYISIRVNEKTIRMFEMKQLTIGDCLVQAGIEINKLYGKPGIASIISLNGKSITLPGELGQAPTILLNKEKSSVDSIVQNGVEIEIIKGNDGKQPNVTLLDLLGDVPSIQIQFNHQQYELKPIYNVNNMIKDQDYLIQDRDVIEVRTPKTVKDFFTFVSSEKQPDNKEFVLYVNNQKVNLSLAETQIVVNGNPVPMDYKLKQHDHLQLIPRQIPNVKLLLNQLNKELHQQIRVVFNQESIIMNQPQLIVKNGKTVLSEDDRIYPDDMITIEDKVIEPIIFQDIFRYIDLDLTNASGNFTLMKNNQPTTFYEQISDGDNLAIIWEKK
ncbi:cell division protein FtsA [Paucisalibacillus globulus]|uniref:cell division protein FtsA n=1 Tax=Paucisalibacillus globulus TaxID=351095 RepID=UPI000418EB17|nr:cell division FtsA domain-containing protein [Paucisalibacillus globulus]